jgi:CBS domain-containing protein
MKVSDILRVKGSTLYTVSPTSRWPRRCKTMAEHDIGSLVVMEHGDLVGMLTFREVIQAVVRNGGSRGHADRAFGDGRRAADLHPRDRDRRGAPHDAGRHARYMPVLDGAR